MNAEFELLVNKLITLAMFISVERYPHKRGFYKSTWRNDEGLLYELLHKGKSLPLNASGVYACREL